MNVKRRPVLLGGLVAALGAPAWPQGFAGMARDPEGFALPQPAPRFDFPADHAAHPDYRIEWWYITANLVGADGTPYGAQWTLFRSALAPPQADAGAPWDSRQIWFAHAAVTTAAQHHSADTYARGGIGQAGTQTAPFLAWINDWAMTGRAAPGADAYDAVTLTARGGDFAYTLALDAEGPLVFHGDGGYSVKSEKGQASYYYSQPHYRAAGTLELPQGPVEVTGRAWLDREWSSQPLAETQTGWDWFSLHFDSGDKLMAFRLRDREGEDFTSATWIDPEGKTTPIPNGQIALEPGRTARVAGRDVPVRWRLSLPARGLAIETRPLNPDSWMETAVPYWEGPVTVTGSHGGKGYLEMTGYG